MGLRELPQLTVPSEEPADIRAAVIQLQRIVTNAGEVIDDLEMADWMDL